MSDTGQTWKRINDKLQQAFQQFQLLQKENERLRRELVQLKQKEAQQHARIGELELKVTALKAATGQLEETDKKELEKRLSQYIRDIDRCIALLSG